jgi:UDP-2,3-diacylglucosamine hydrolase
VQTLTAKKIGLIAGEGELPVRLAEAAKKNGFEVIAVALSCDNRNELKQHCGKIYAYGPGEIEKILSTLHEEQIKDVTFIGKVHKGLLFRNPRLDGTAIKLLKQKTRLNDDAIMLTLSDELNQEGINVLDQTFFLKEMLAVKCVYGKYLPDENQLADIEYGFNTAKEIGKIDIGQTVIVKNKMILAVEAIEGTDRTIQRGCKLGKKDAIVVKVSKPKQDNRFDVPTVGLGTLKTIKKYGGKILAVEAGKTFIVGKNEMIRFADKNKMVFIAV